jgi:hypothetical protein
MAYVISFQCLGREGRRVKVGSVEIVAICCISVFIKTGGPQICVSGVGRLCSLLGRTRNALHNGISLISTATKIVLVINFTFI